MESQEVWFCVHSCQSVLEGPTHALGTAQLRVNAYQRSVADVHPELMKRDGLCPRERDGEQEGFVLPSVAVLTRKGLRVVICTALMAIKVRLNSMAALDDHERKHTALFPPKDNTHAP